MDLLSFFPLALKFLLACTIKSSLVLAVTWLAAGSLRRRSAALRHRVWASGILGSMALPVFMFLLPAWQTAPLIETEQLSSVPMTHAKAGLDSLSAMIIHARMDSPLPSELAGVVLVVWMMGCVFVALRLVVGLAKVARASNRAKPDKTESWLICAMELCRSLQIARPVQVLRLGNPHAMPITWGFLRPRVLIPENAGTWAESRVRIVLSHELTHIARHDWILQITAQVTCSLYWFNPLMWIGAKNLREESERACDDAVLNSGIEPASYAAEILELARRLQNPFRGWSAALAIARTTDLERRFKAMLNPSIDRRCVSWRSRLLMSFLVVVLLLPLAAITLPGENGGGKLAGTIHDSGGAAVGNATVILSGQKTDAVFMTVSGTEGNFVLKGLPYGEYELKVVRRGFADYRPSHVVLEPGRDLSENISLQMAADIKGSVEASESGTNGQLDARIEGATARVQVEGKVQAAGVVDRVAPIYPQNAKSAGVQGSVKLDAIIGMDGRPKLLWVVNTEINPELARSAIEAVSKWRYRPMLVNGKSVEVETTVMVVYSLEP